MSKPVCLVTGVGPETGTGAEIAKRFSQGGYQVAMIARDAERFEAVIDGVAGVGGLYDLMRRGRSLLTGTKFRARHGAGWARSRQE